MLIFNRYNVNWLTPADLPLYDPRPEGQDWLPGEGIHYERMNFTLNDIPYEYSDWILRDPDMDLESYGPTDHDINSLKAWIIDQGINESDPVFLQIIAHYYANLRMDDYLKYMFSNTDAFHYTNLMEGGWSDINEMWDDDISYMKNILVENIADKLEYQHLEEVQTTLGKCDVCGKNHAEKRDLAAAEQIVNQFFVDTYGFDISAY